MRISFVKSMNFKLDVFAQDLFPAHSCARPYNTASEFEGIAERNHWIT